VTDIVNKPGVYLFRDRFDQVIYVGKAKSLRKRLPNYFQPSRTKTADLKLRSLVNSIDSFELFPVRTEQEAILLESRFIKQYTPRYNVLLRDDKRFLLIKIDVNSPFPRLSLARLKKDDGCLYYGPFPRQERCGTQSII
jgi:excinuclease ABC subunit C